MFGGRLPTYIFLSAFTSDYALIIYILCIIKKGFIYCSVSRAAIGFLSGSIGNIAILNN